MNKKYVFCREKHSKGAKNYNKKERFIMSRTTRNNMENSSFFHIMVQGINKERIFNTDKNKEKYLKLIYKNNEGVDIIAYCMMNNHAYLYTCVDYIHENPVKAFICNKKERN